MTTLTLPGRSRLLALAAGGAWALPAGADPPPPTADTPIILDSGAPAARASPGRALLGRTTGGALGLPIGCEHFDDFSTYTLTDLTNPPLTLVPLDGQISPANSPWATEPFFGAADAETLLAAGATPPAGAPLNGLGAARFAVSARGTIATPRNTALGIAGAVRHVEFFPVINDPVIISQDIYVASPDAFPRTSTWWSPISFANGTIYDRIFFGGSNLTGALAGFGNASGVMDRFLSLGRTPDGNGVVFYGSVSTPVLRVPTNAWFSLMVHMSTAGYSVWVKTPISTSVNPPFLDPRMASGQIPPADGDPVGWVNTYPGMDDDLSTTTVREGIGLARSAAGDTVPLLGEFSQAPIFSSATFDGIQYGWGFDDPTNAFFQPRDVFFANYCVSGASLTSLCIADLNNDAVVNGADIAVILNGFGDPFLAFGPLDLNGDGAINGGDIAVILNQIGPCQ